MQQNRDRAAPQAHRNVIEVLDDRVLMSGDPTFLADDGANGQELWRSDGTSAGTIRLTDLGPAAGSANIQALTIE
jgi:ELWxxDGT repeat protein